MSPPLQEVIREAAEHSGVLLIVCDFDGVLAPIVAHPDHAAMTPGAQAAIDRLQRARRTHVAVLSGRSLADLRRRIPRDSGVLLVGGHGAEPEHLPGPILDAPREAALRSLAEALEAITRDHEGAVIEHKPASIALHHRACTDEVRARLCRTVQGLHRRHPPLEPHEGLMVIEYRALAIDKGHGLIGLMNRAGASKTLFIGDDVTDEDAFRAINGFGVGIKVGPGDTIAEHRIRDPSEVESFLIALSEARLERTEQNRSTGIERFSILSDQRTIALIGPDADLAWLCLPRADSAAAFASLLSDRSRGEFSIQPLDDEAPPAQSYVESTLVLRTAWKSVTLHDYLDATGGRAFQRAGRTDLIRHLEGTGRVRIRFAPRLDFGRVPTTLALRDGGIEVEGAADPFVLVASGLAWRIEQEGAHHTAVAEVDLSSGPLTLEMRYGFGSLGRAPLSEPDRRRQSERFWSGWAATLHIPDLTPDLIRRSALTIKALCYGPSGAIFAAATTSLPEHLGGVRNWDYRYCWPRDASLAAAALLRLGNTGVAMKLLDWLVGVVDRCDSPERLKPLYSITGSELGPEAEIGALPGYERSAPVRVGNAADHQVQLDVFGPIVDLVSLLAERGAPVTPEHWRLVQAMVQAVATRWREPDHGIWEVRGPKRHHVHTKIMCWHAVDRAIRVASFIVGRSPDAWHLLREGIREDVLTHGWSENARAFTFAYDCEALDAAVLHIGLTGLVPPSDKRFRSTVEAIDRTLRRGPVVYRYLLDDGLPGVEGGFHICTAWLIESLALIGEVDRARALYQEMASLAGPTGMLAEQYEPHARITLGNTPQAYSHLGLINAAVRLAQS